MPDRFASLASAVAAERAATPRERLSPVPAPAPTRKALTEADVRSLVMDELVGMLTNKATRRGATGYRGAVIR